MWKQSQKQMFLISLHILKGLNHVLGPTDNWSMWSSSRAKQGVQVSLHRELVIHQNTHLSMDFYVCNDMKVSIPKDWSNLANKIADFIFLSMLGCKNFSWLE